MTKATTPSTGVALFSQKAADTPPSYLETTAPQGNDSVSTDAMAMPRIKLMQGISPELSETVRAGQFLNTITGKAYDKLFVVNLHFQRSFAVYKKRDLGGGFIGSAESETDAQRLVEQLPGNPATDYEITESARHVLVILDPETGLPTETVAMFLNNKSGLYTSRAWNTEINTLTQGRADRFAPVWQLSSAAQRNQKGTFHTIVTTHVGWASQELHAECVKLFAAINSAASIAA